jgi:TonB family protein
MRMICRLLLLSIYLTGNVELFAQVRQFAEVMPQFEGSTDGLKKWLTQNMSYPQEALQNKEEGRVVVNFIITEDGSVTQPRVTFGVSPSLDAEALRLVSQMPKWIPASQEGKPCSIEYSLPIKFKLPAINQQNSSIAQSSDGNPNQDKWVLLPNHKIYEGEFEAFGLPAEYGRAKYQYIENGDGTRIFDGAFEYKANGMIVEGQFKNDYQEGKWAFRGNNKTSYLNFSHGYPTEDFVVYSFYRESMVYEDGSRGSRIVMSGDGYRGWLTGLFFLEKAEYQHVDVITSKGYHVRYNYSSNKIINCQIIGNKDIKWDEWIGFYKINNMTGDKERINIGVKSPDLKIIGMSIREYLLRSSRSDYWKKY